MTEEQTSKPCRFTAVPCRCEKHQVLQLRWWELLLGSEEGGDIPLKIPEEALKHCPFSFILFFSFLVHLTFAAGPVWCEYGGQTQSIMKSLWGGPLSNQRIAQLSCPCAPQNLIDELQSKRKKRGAASSLQQKTSALIACRDVLLHQRSPLSNT